MDIDLAIFMNAIVQLSTQEHFVKLVLKVRLIIIKHHLIVPVLLVPCDDKPCKNNGVCKNTNVEKGQYKCACNNPWKGKTCELHSGM